MAQEVFEHSISKFELDHHCILLRDADKKGKRDHFPHIKLLICCGEKRYMAELNEFYLESKFQAGIHFDKGPDGTLDFFFEQSANLGHRVKITVDAHRPMIDGRHPVDVEVYMVERKVK